MAENATPAQTLIGAVVMVVIGVFAYNTCAKGGGEDPASRAPALEASVTDWSMTPAGRVRVIFRVQNPTTSSTTPECGIEVKDLDGVAVDFDFITAEDLLGAGAHANYNVMTGIQPDYVVGGVDVTCEGSEG